jgi:phage-related protein
MATAISFDSNDLQTTTILTAEIAHSRQKNMSAYPIAHANKSEVAFVSYPNRKIVVKGKLIAGGIAAMDALEDAFAGYFNGIKKNLDIGFNGGTRRFIATANAVEVNRPGGLHFGDFAVEFFCSNPFGLDTSTTTALNVTSRTAASYTDAYTFLGTAPIQLPVFTYTLSAVTGGSNASVIIGNLGNGQQITVTRTWTAGEVLVIDCVNRTVKVNGNPVEYSGAFPEFAPGAQSFSYSDTFTTRQFNLNIVYTKMYQ